MTNYKQILKDFVPKDQSDFRFMEEEHLWLPRVTHILNIIAKGKGFENWLKQKGDKADTLKEEAGDFGSNIHTHLEEIGKGIKINIEALKPRERRCVEAFIKWKDENVKRFVETEHPIVNLEYGYVGTLDAIVETKDGKIALLDYKTSKYIYDTYKLQIGAYYKGYPKKIDTAFILRFEKREKEKKSLEIKEINNLDFQFEIFLCALRLWYWKNKWKFE